MTHDTKQSPIPEIWDTTATQFYALQRRAIAAEAKITELEERLPRNPEPGLTAARPASTDDRVGIESKPLAGSMWTEEFEELCIRALYQCFEQRLADTLAPARWKDGIDINYLSSAAKLFIFKVTAPFETKITALESTNSVLLQDSENREKQWKILYNLYGESKAELTALEAQNAELRQQNKDAWTNRDHFCEYINKIGYLFWAEDKQCYAPDAVFRMVEDLQTKFIALESSSQMLQVKLDAATEDRDKWLAEHNRLQRDRDVLQAERDRNQDFYETERSNHMQSIEAWKLDEAKVKQLTRERDAALVKWQAANNRAVAAELRSEDNL